MYGDRPLSQRPSYARICVLALALIAGAAPLRAQARPARTLISLNPLGLPFKYVSAELEQKINTFATVGGSFSYLDVGNGSYTSLEGKFRLYPNEEAFQGFSIGLAGGITHIAETYSPESGKSDKSDTSPTIAVLADYNWLLGKTKRVVVGGGVGAKRIFVSCRGYSEINCAYPTARFQVGVLF